MTTSRHLGHWGVGTWAPRPAGSGSERRSNGVEWWQISTQGTDFPIHALPPEIGRVELDRKAKGGEAIRRTPDGATAASHAVHQPAGRSRTR